MTLKEQNKILDDKIESNNNQYKVDRLNAEISAFSSDDLNKYEFLTRKDLNYKPNALDKPRFEFSPLGRAFNEGLDKTVVNYQEEGVIKLLKDIRDNLAGGIFIPGPPGPSGPGGPPGPGGQPGPKPRLRPRPGTSDDGDNFAKEMDAKNKEHNDFINKIKSNESNLKKQREHNDLMKKIKKDQLNLERQKEIDTSDKEFNDAINKMKSDRLKDDTDKTNQTDENDLDENDLELIKANLELGDLKPLRPSDTIDLSISRTPIIQKKNQLIKKLKDFWIV